MAMQVKGLWWKPTDWSSGIGKLVVLIELSLRAQLILRSYPFQGSLLQPHYSGSG